MIALAGLLGVLLVCNMAHSANRDGIVVSLQGLDTATVVSLPKLSVRKDAASILHGADADVAAAVKTAETVAAAVPHEGMVAARFTDVLPRANPLRSAFGVNIDTIKAAAIGPVSGALMTLVGIASTYNPYRSGDNVAGSVETASGELYDPDAWTAAIQIDLRSEFGGVRYGRLYRPVYALVECGDSNGSKRAIVKINDVGPLKPGRVIDLNERAMRYFDPSLERGLLPETKISVLPGEDWTPGPVGDAPVGNTLVGIASAL